MFSRMFVCIFEDLDLTTSGTRMKANEGSNRGGAGSPVDQLMSVQATLDNPARTCVSIDDDPFYLLSFKWELPFFRKIKQQELKH